MGLWTPAPELDPGETVVSSMTANHTQGARAVGGRLFVTDRALRFVASRFDRLLGGRDHTIPRDEVRRASVADRSLEGGPFTGGMRRRLSVSTDGGDEAFVVNRVDDVAARIGEWASATW